MENVVVNKSRMDGFRGKMLLSKESAWLKMVKQIQKRNDMSAVSPGSCLPQFGSIYFNKLLDY